MGETRFGLYARDRWTCRTFAHRLAPELKADLRDVIRERGSVRRSSVLTGWSKKKGRILPTKSSMAFGQYLSTWNKGSCG